MEKARRDVEQAIDQVAETKSRHSRELEALARRRLDIEAALDAERLAAAERRQQATEIRDRIASLRETAVRLHAAAEVAHRRRLVKEKVAAQAKSESDSLSRQLEAARLKADKEASCAATMLAQYNAARFWYHE